MQYYSRFWIVGTLGFVGEGGGSKYIPLIEHQARDAYMHDNTMKLGVVHHIDIT